MRLALSSITTPALTGVVMSDSVPLRTYRDELSLYFLKR
jgi:hypothetical protein